MNSLLASILAVAVFGVLVQGAKYLEECSADSDCSETGNYCAKYSDCDKGLCVCMHTYYRDGTTCKKYGKMLEGGDACDLVKIGLKEEKCEGDHPICTGCKATDLVGRKCKSGAPIAVLASPILFIAPVLFKLFY